MFNKDTKAMLNSKDAVSDFFDIITGVLFAPFSTIICFDYIL